MVINYDKTEVREALTADNVFQLLEEWGGDPEYSSFGILSSTICHNPAGAGSRKLYWYQNTGFFRCYTGCEEPSFDIFDLMIRVYKIQKNQDLSLNEAVRYIAFKFGIIGSKQEEDTINQIIDWNILSNYDRIGNIEIKDYHIQLKPYDEKILNRFNYSLRIAPWIKEGISPESMRLAHIGFYPGGAQITIPHYDINGQLIGLRGRTLSEEDAEKYGKYRPLKVNQTTFSHPLGMNLYGLNWAKDAIKLFGKAIIFEGEKAVLRYITEFGLESDIAVACCGSNISAYQIQALLDLGVQEIIVAFDRQFQRLNDEEHKRLIANLKKIHGRYHNYVAISFIFDKDMITEYKASPIDESKEKFLQLYKNRVFLTERRRK